MGATDLLCHLRGAGLVLTLTPVGGLRVAPRSALTDDHRAVIRAERDALVLALHAENSRSRLPENIDPDRCCWPHTQAMNTDEIDLFAGRLARFTDKGVGYDDAERLADKLVIRDRESDDRRLCLECVHLHGNGRWRCGNWEAADVAPQGLAPELVLALQRCSGFNKR